MIMLEYHTVTSITEEAVIDSGHFILNITHQIIQHNKPAFYFIFFKSIF
jgi:hypothetical protein